MPSASAAMPSSRRLKRSGSRHAGPNRRRSRGRHSPPRRMRWRDEPRRPAPRSIRRGALFARPDAALPGAPNRPMRPSVAERPSWLQIAVAGLAVAVLPAPTAERNGCNLACRARRGSACRLPKRWSEGPRNRFRPNRSAADCTIERVAADQRIPLALAQPCPGPERTDASRDHRPFVRRQHSALRCPR